MTPLALGNIMLAGYRLIQSLNHQLENHIGFSNGYKSSVEALAEMIRVARLKLADVDYGGKTPKEVIDTINKDKLLS